ncbi:MAG: hypothetical protein KC944_22250, partial [Candidatus Omnitrophica bacterium]|nr:hypothetical protein [Candidatus Omnitrophota bacterium]
EEKSTAAQIGIDPKGGTDPESEDIVWSRLLESPDCSVPLQVQTTAKSGQATVFLRHFQGGDGFNVVGFDEAVLIEQEGGEEAPHLSSFRVY